LKELVKQKFPRAGRRNPFCEGNCERCPKCDFGEYTGTSNLNGCECANCRQTVLASRWFLCVTESYGEHKTSGQIERSYRWTHGTVGSVLQQIRRYHAGVRQDGKPRTGRPRGRPKKIVTEAADAVYV
jgi:hypothetical protein